jgi:hypothetical protein
MSVGLHYILNFMPDLKEIDLQPSAPHYTLQTFRFRYNGCPLLVHPSAPDPGIDPTDPANLKKKFA